MFKTSKPRNTTRIMWMIFISLIIASLFLSGCGEAQAPKVYHIGILSGLDFVADTTNGFKEGMAELGYVEGENIVYDVQQTNFDMDAYRSILQKFVADEVDLIVSFPTEATIEAKLATEGTDIPVVFSFALIEDMNIVNSIREPGGNITGVRYPGVDISVKRLEILLEIMPDAKNILIPYQRDYPIVPPQLEQLRSAAKSTGVTLIELPVNNAEDLQTEFESRLNSGDIGFDAILMIVEPFAVTPDNYSVIAAFAYQNNIPFGGAYVPAGDYADLFGVDVLSFNSGKDAAVLADKILKGTPAGTIPVASADQYLRIDYKVAQKFGLNVPNGLLKQADEIIR